MRFSIASLLLLVVPTITFAHPQAAPALQERDALTTILNPRSPKGGGGGGGRGGGSSSSGSSGSSSSGSSGSSSSSGGGRSSSSSSSSSSSGGGRTSSSSNAGGATSRGSGASKNYGGGRFYGGGSTAPYSAGKSSPRGIAALPLVGAGLLVFPGLWLYGAYAYPYGHPYSYRNRTARRNRTATSTSTSASATPTAPTRRSLVDRFFEIEMRQATDEGVDETKPVTCLCAMYSVCGCDDSDDTTFLDQVIGDGDYSKLNASLVQIADINGTSTIVLNGTLPNGTTASGGVDDEVPGSASTLSIGGSVLGYWVMIALVGFTCFLV